MIKRIITSFVCLAFIVTGVVPAAMAQQLVLPPPGQVLALSPVSAPCLLRGMRVDAKDPLRMDFLFDQGRASLSAQEFNDESLRLIKYFLVSLTIPNKDLWVNLSPYESQRIVQEDLGRTAMGRDLLAQDYILKQLTASLLHPDGATGKVFWKEVYRRAYEAYGTTDIPVDTFNKVWIMPGRSLLHEMLSPDGKQISAFVDKVELKVMLESDYVAAQANALVAPTGTPDSSAVLMAKEVLRQVVVPVLEKEVNEGANFATLRQIVHSLVLSAWLKKKLMAGAGRVTGVERTGPNAFAQVFIDRHKTLGNEIAHPQEEDRQIYDRYVEAFRKGAYSLIKEEVDTYSQELIPRKYFSGGFTADDIDASMKIEHGTPDKAQGDYTSVLVVLKKLKKLVKIMMSDKEPVVKARKFVLKVALLASFGAIGWCTFHQQAPRDTQMEAPVKIVAAEEKLDGLSMLRIVEAVTKGKQQYDSGIIDGDAAKVTTEGFLCGVLVQPMPSGLSQDARNKGVEKRSKKLAIMIHKNVQVFGKALLGAGLSEKDVALLIASIWARESSGNGLDVQVLPGGVKQAAGASQFEFRTWWEQLYIAEDVLKDYPGEFQDFYRKVKAEQNKPLGSFKENFWLQVEGMVITPEENLRMTIILLNHMINNRPVPVRVILNDADTWLNKKFHVVLPADIQREIATPATTLAEFMKQLADKPQHQYVSKRQVLMYLLALEWNGGKNRTAEELMAAVEYESLSDQARINYQQRAVKVVGETRKSMMVSMGRVYRILKANNIRPGPIFAKDAKRTAALIAAYGKIEDISPAVKAEFLKEWFSLRRAEDKYLVAYDKLRVIQSVHYGEIILSQAGVSSKSPYTLGLMFRENRDSSKKIMSEVKRDMEAARGKVLGSIPTDGKSSAVKGGSPVKMSNAEMAKVKLKAVEAKVKVKAKVAAAKIKVKAKVVDVKAKVQAKIVVMKAKLVKAKLVVAEAKARHNNKQTKDHKSSGDKSQAPDPYGGIDLTDQAAGMDVQGDAGSFRFDLSPAQIKALDQDVQGILPLIINVQPVSDVRMFLGFGKQASAAT